MSTQITDYRVIIGKNIKIALKRKGESQAWLAEELDMHSSQLNGYIKGKSMPNPDLFAKIADKLDLTVKQLLCREHVSSEDSPGFLAKIAGDDDVEDFSLTDELKAECQSISNYAKTMKQSTSNEKIQSLSNLIYNKAIFVKDNI